MSAKKPPKEPLSARRQKARLNDLCLACAAKKPVRSTKYCGECTARRAKWSGRK